MDKAVKKKDLIIFALIWSLIFLIIGIYPTIFDGDLRVWAIVISGIFLLTILVKPYLLSGFYHSWIKIGEFIGNIISKIILFVLFFGIFTPVSIVLKILGKDLLRKKTGADSKTYWIERDMQPQSMKNQY